MRSASNDAESKRGSGSRAGVRSAVQRLGRLTALDALAAVAGQAHRYVRLDVFTEVPLQGNALAVFPGAAGLSGANMQRIARELNLSESVFVLAAREAGDFRLRIFTPTRELAFAGHPVLGAAFLAATALGSDAVALETGAGLVEIELRRDAARVSFGWMAQPIPTWHAYERADELLRALGVSRSGLPIEAYTNGPVHVYVELDSEAAVAGLRPDFGALGGLGEVGVSCFAGAGRAWKTRMFAPALGVAEDPATGSAAGPLAVHLARHARIGFGEEIEISQGVEIGRPSVLHGRADGAREHIERVAVGGAAVITGCGELRLPAE